MLQLDAVGDLLHLETDDVALRRLATRLWDETGETGTPGFRVTIRVAGTFPDGDPEERLNWTLGDEVRLAAPGMSLTIRPFERRAEGTADDPLAPRLASRRLLSEVSPKPGRNRLQSRQRGEPRCEPLDRRREGGLAPGRVVGRGETERRQAPFPHGGQGEWRDLGVLEIRGDLEGEKGRAFTLPLPRRPNRRSLA